MARPGIRSHRGSPRSHPRYDSRGLEGLIRSGSCRCLARHGNDFQPSLDSTRQILDCTRDFDRCSRKGQVFCREDNFRGNRAGNTPTSGWARQLADERCNLLPERNGGLQVSGLAQLVPCFVTDPIAGLAVTRS